MDAPPLRRGLLGYRPSSVRALLADRDTMFSKAAAESQAAQNRAAALAIELESAKDAHRAVSVERDAAKGAVVHLEDELARERAAKSALSEELDDVRSQLLVESQQRRNTDAMAAELRKGIEAAEEREARLRADLLASRTDLESTKGELSVSRQDGREALERLRVADAAADGLRSQLDRERARAEGLLVQERDAVAAKEEQEAARATPATDGLSADELAAAIASAAEALAGTAAKARALAEEELAGAHEERARILEEIATLSAWREKVQHVIDGVIRAASDAQLEIARTERRITESVAPTTDALTEVARWLGDLNAIEAPVDDPVAPVDIHDPDTGSASTITLTDDSPSHLEFSRVPPRGPHSDPGWGRDPR
jgi:chromosome segregation ATPase